MTDPDTSAVRLSRRHMLSGMAVLPAAAAAAPAAAAQVLGGTSMPAIARVAMAQGLDMDRIMSWMADDYNHDLTLESYAQYAESAHKILGRIARPHDITRIMDAPMCEYDQGMEAVMRLKDIFSPEAKFAHFMRYKQPGESVDGWLNSSLFHDPESTWQKSLKLLDTIGLSPDSELSLEQFAQQGRREIGKQLRPAIRDALRQHAPSVKGLVQEWAEEGRLEEVKALLKEGGSEVEAQEWDKLFGEPEPMELVVFEVARLKDKQGKARYSIITDHGQAHAREYLCSLYPALASDAVLWWENMVTVPPGSSADRLLTQLAIDTALPQPQVTQPVRTGTAAQCAATAQAMKR